MIGCCPKVLKQPNGYDCGPFVLQYLESFYKTPIQDFCLPIKNLEQWFKLEVILFKRSEVAKLIRDLSAEQFPDKSIFFPPISFPSTSGSGYLHGDESSDDKNSTVVKVESTKLEPVMNLTNLKVCNSPTNSGTDANQSSMLGQIEALQKGLNTRPENLVGHSHLTRSASGKEDQMTRNIKFTDETSKLRAAFNRGISQRLEDEINQRQETNQEMVETLPSSGSYISPLSQFGRSWSRDQIRKSPDSRRSRSRQRYSRDRREHSPDLEKEREERKDRRWSSGQKQSRTFNAADRSQPSYQSARGESSDSDHGKSRRRRSRSTSRVQSRGSWSKSQSKDRRDAPGRGLASNKNLNNVT